VVTWRVLDAAGREEEENEEEEEEEENEETRGCGCPSGGMLLYGGTWSELSWESALNVDVYTNGGRVGIDGMEFVYVAEADDDDEEEDDDDNNREKMDQ
jgi:hypothetical protein